MFDSSYPSASKKGYSEDVTYLPTAEKSQYRYETEPYIDRTPERHQFASPSGKSSRASEARKSINDCIYLVSEKKKMNEEAIGEVQQVNSEIISSLSSYNPVKQNLFDARNKTTEPNRRDDRDYVAVSQFDWRSSANAAQDDFKQSYRETPANLEHGDLRARLNNEIRKNNDLLKYVANLETEVTSLKASRFATPINQTMNEVLEENRYLKNQLAVSQSKVPYNLIEELERLKAENNALRRDTVNLLKAKQY